MKKDTKIYLSLVVIVILIIIGIYYVKGDGVINEKTAKCIGENSALYVQLGCSACKAQEEMFGKNYQYLTAIDCFYERELCLEKQITSTPTWVINEQYYKGVKDIEELKILTGC